MNQILPITDEHRKKMENLRYIRGFRKTMDFLYDGETGTIAPLFFIKSNYVEWSAIFDWLVINEIKGKKLVEFFQNESPDGGGYHLGVTHILSRIKGHKNTIVGIKGNELKKHQ